MYFVTSDQHFNHTNALRLMADTRPFESVQEMNETLIDNWNAVVGEDDITFVLGDFFMGRAEDVREMLNRLNGRIILIVGNHDTDAKLRIYRDMPEKIIDIDDGYIFEDYNGISFCMNHYPVEGDSVKHRELESKGWHNCVSYFNEHPESIYLYGHVHGNAPCGPLNGTYHVGVDTNNLTPISLDEIIEKFKFANSFVCV